MYTDDIVNEYMPYIQEEACKYRNWANYYDGNNLEIEDFISCGTEGLLAASEFPPEPPELVSSIDDYFKNAISEALRDYRNKEREFSELKLMLLKQPILASKSDKQLLERLLQALYKLTPQERELLQMHMEGCSFKEMGDSFEKSGEWARQKYHEIVKFFRVLLE